MRGHLHQIKIYKPGTSICKQGEKHTQLGRMNYRKKLGRRLSFLQAAKICIFMLILNALIPF
jgi:hypothetical protein